MGNALFVTRMSARKHSYAYAMNATLVLMGEGASYVAHLEYPMHITALNVRDWKKTEMGAQRLSIWEPVVRIYSMNGDV